MTKIIQFIPNKHIYKLERCSGCGVDVGEEYTEVTLPMNDKKFHHIALCDSCRREAEKVGAF